jgi:metallo-beta-lactamase family protein
VELHTLGAAGEVTGSCHLLRFGRHRVLLDCGLFQGSARDEARNREQFPFPVSNIDAVVLSHAHIDHSGRLPLLVKAGYRGPIYAQRATRDLCRIMLRDVAALQQRDLQIGRRMNRRASPRPDPLYDAHDVQRTMRQFVPLEYDVRTDVLPGLAIRLANAGHILGAAIVECWVTEAGASRKIVYSGDLGHAGASTMPPPARVDAADLIVLESTYGNREHRTMEATLEETREVLDAAFAAGGNVLIPAFAVGRTQELLYQLSRHFDAWNVGRWQIFLDSPLAIDATEVYLRYRDQLSPEALAEFGSDLPSLPNLHLSRTAAQSSAINRIRGGAIIIAGSGMCTGGRILHHLRQNVARAETHVVIVGFQAQGTLGRALVEGARTVRIWNDTLTVNARVHTIGGLSAHADRRGLLDWYGHIEGHPPVVLVHGESAARMGLAGALRERFGAAVELPAFGSSVDLTAASITQDA